MPELNTHGHVVATSCLGAVKGVYRGFCLRGKPDGRGEWVAACGESYVGDWRGGVMHGQGKETCLFGYTYTGKFRDGTFVRGRTTGPV
jgi:hypothetical protein